MLAIYRDHGAVVQAAATLELPSDAIWIDLVDPTDQERAFVESRTDVRVPSKEALSEIEVSSRLIVENGILYLSTNVAAQGDKLEAYLCPAGFILSPKLLVTVRYTQLSTFDHVAEKISGELRQVSSVSIFTALLEAIVDRGADVLERLSAEIDQISRSVFGREATKLRRRVPSTERLHTILSGIGRTEDRVSQARDVLLGVGRIATFAADVGQEWIAPEFQARLGSASKDILSLTEYDAHLSGKVQFLLDAVLGYITIEQNEVFKVLTIVSVVGIPPTLLAGVWGMNFKEMPELNWHLGYPLALLVIALSAIAPLAWFKRRGWF